jgi:hypothetical protein
MKTTKHTFALLSLSTLILAGGAGGCALSVEADVPEVQVTQHDLAFDGVGAQVSALAGDVSMTRSFSQQHQKLDLPSGLDSKVDALGLTLTATSGVTDFSFIHNLRLTMTDDVHDPIELVSYQQDPNAAPSNVLVMKSANPVNTLDQWKTDSATFTVEVAGTLPANDWTADLTISFSGTIKYTY